MPRYAYVRDEWMNAIPRREALTEQDSLFLSTLDSVVPVNTVIANGKTTTQVFSDWLDAGRAAGVVTGGEAARLWKTYAAAQEA